MTQLGADVGVWGAPGWRMQGMCSGKKGWMVGEGACSKETHPEVGLPGAVHKRHAR